jgi:hypothetical protein
VASAAAESDAIMNAIDIILRGYPVGVPHERAADATRRFRPD